MPDDRKEIGKIAEDAVVSHLNRRGFEILERNFRKRFGEIDIIARKDSRFHFIEVKSQRPHSDVPVGESWDQRQRERFVNLVETYLAENSKEIGDDFDVSFDFASVEMNAGGLVERVKILFDAFRPDSEAPPNHN